MREKPSFAQVIHQWFLDSSQSRKDREKAWDDIYRRSHPSYVDPRVPHPKVKIPRTYRNVRTKLSWLIRQAKSNGRWVNMYAPAADDAGLAETTMTDLINSSFENPAVRNEMSLIRGARKGIKYGDQYWLERPHYVTSANEEPRFVDSKTVNLNIDDVFPDFFGDRWYIIRRHITMYEFESMVAELSRPALDPDGEPLLNEKDEPIMEDGGVAQRALAAVQATIDAGTFPDRYGWHWQYASYSNERPDRYGRVSGDDPERNTARHDSMSQMLTILEFHENQGDYRVAKVIPDVPPGRRDPKASFPSGVDLFLQTPRPSPYGQCQIVHWSPNFEDDEAWGYGLAEISGKNEEAADHAYRQSLRLLFRLADPPIAYSEEERLPAHVLRSPAGKAIPLQKPGEFGYVEPSNRGDAGILAGQIISQASDLGQAESAQRAGTPSKGPATNASIAEQGAQSDDIIVAATFFMAMEELARLKLAIYRKHAPREMIVAVAGHGTPRMVTLRAEFLDDDIDYLIRAGGSPWGQNSQQKVSTYVQMAAGAFAQIADMRELGLRILRETGTPDPEKIFPGGDNPVMDPEDEHRMLLQGRKPRVNAQENLVEHFAAHQAFVQNTLPNIPGVSAEIFLLANQHLAETFAALQLQQSQGAGQGNGTIQTQPVQPGVGQPAALNERTATLNEDRQSANLAAAGAAPTPTNSRAAGDFARGPGA